MGILDWFMPSPYSKAHTLLKKKNLIAQTMILNASRKQGYTTFSTYVKSVFYNLL